jgi:hypothetical protein
MLLLSTKMPSYHKYFTNTLQLESMQFYQRGKRKPQTTVSQSQHQIFPYSSYYSFRVLNLDRTALIFNSLNVNIKRQTDTNSVNFMPEFYISVYNINIITAQ